MDPQTKLLEAQRNQNKFYEMAHNLGLEDIIPLSNKPIPKYTDIILEQFITFDEELIEIKNKIRKLASSDIPILILGESGTGKELIAKALHGDRDPKKLIPVNCAAIPENLLESEFFGHKKGSFTGATGDKRGLIEEANDGTLFLDEIGEMPHFLQAKLLRTLEDKSFRKVGDVSSDVKVNFRLVSATNRESINITQDKFRSDLYYRLAGSVIKLKPLRERPIEDVVMLIRMNCTDINLAEKLIDETKGHKWPGNIRELLWRVREYNVLNS